VTVLGSLLLRLSGSNCHDRKIVLLVCMTLSRIQVIFPMSILSDGCTFQRTQFYTSHSSDAHNADPHE